ncbi:unnamed protein product [Closterium sp. Yama58-4]|nr:unnamed protein product [Closterium sp. Yama58-4]
MSGVQLSGGELIIVIACVLLTVGVCLYPWKRQTQGGSRSDASQPRQPETVKGLPDDLRDQLSVVVIAPRDLAELEDQCPICLTDYEVHDVQQQLPCGHHFHQPCLDAWFTSHATCPVCRVQLTPQPDNPERDQQGAGAKGENKEVEAAAPAVETTSAAAVEAETPKEPEATGGDAAPAGEDAAPAGEDGGSKKRKAEGEAGEEEGDTKETVEVKPSEEGAKGDGGDAQAKKKSGPVVLGPQTFATGLQMFNFFLDLLRGWPVNLDINQYEHMVLLDLLKKGHSDPTSKVGPGIRSFQIRPHPEFHSRCFFLVRTDGTVDDFSYRKCVEALMGLPQEFTLSAAKEWDSNGEAGGHGGGGGARGLGTNSVDDGNSDSFAAAHTDRSRPNEWKEFEALLVCPLSNEPLRFDSTTSEYISDSIGVAYPVVNGIPPVPSILPVCALVSSAVCIALDTAVLTSAGGEQQVGAMGEGIRDTGHDLQNGADSATRAEQEAMIGGANGGETGGEEEEEEEEHVEVSPEATANPISKLIFWWLNPLMNEGYRKPLEQADLPPLPPCDDAKAVSVKFAHVWEQELHKDKPSLTRALFRCFRYRLIIGALVQFVNVLLQATPPIFLNAVLLFIQGTPTDHFMKKIFGDNFGYYAAAALFVVPTIRSLLDAQYNQIMFRLGVHVKTALVEIVYDKSLKLSNGARQGKSVGEIVTLMQVDTEKVSMTTPFLHFTWSGLLQIFINLGLLIYYIGWSAVAGFAMLIITIPTQGKLVSLLLAMQRKILLNTGRRVKVINELLQGIRVVKCYAWEQPFTAAIAGIRSVELKAMRSRVWLRAVQTCFMLATPTLIMVVTFAFYAEVAHGSMMASTVFTALSLFNSLRIPLMIYPFVINSVLAGHVSLQRLGKYLSSPEMQHVQKNEDKGDDPVAVSIDHGNFQWSTAKPPAAAPSKPGGSKVAPGMGGSFGAPMGMGGGGPPGSARSAPGKAGGDAAKRGEKKGWWRWGKAKAGPADKGSAGEKGSGAESKDSKDKGKEKEKEKPFALTDVSITVPRGSLFAIVGSVGSGKSSLISAILGEMEAQRDDDEGGDGRKSTDRKSGERRRSSSERRRSSGERRRSESEGGVVDGENEEEKCRVTINGSLAYCSQQAWIMNTSLRENILFGHEYEEDRYNAILDACALRKDLAALPDGDSTEIGERGINLSGGQKQRVALARAVYADTDIVLLDDPLSAVDAHVGAHLFENCVHGILQGKTRVFVTNQLNFVPQADLIAVVDKGTVVEQGTYKELMAQGGMFARLMLESGSHRHTSDDAADAASSSSHSSPSDLAKRSLSRLVSRGRQLGGSKARTRSMSRRFSFSAQGTLVDQEQRARGMLKLEVYKKYWLETSWIIPAGVLMLFVIVQCVDAFTRYWLAYWTKNQFNQSAGFYLGIYASLAMLYTILIYFRTLGQAFLGLWTSKKLHEGMLASVLRAPMSFFDTTPVGRILNRFSADQAGVDETLPFSWSTFLNILFQVFGTIVVVTIVTWEFIIAFIPVACLYFWVQQTYRKTARELKRLDAVSKSPVYQQFTETLNGLPVIRAYNQEERFLRMCDDKLDANNRAFFLLKCCDRWLSVRLELMGNTLVFAAAIFAVVNRGSVFAGFAGISIDYALQITAALGMLVRQMTDTENQMNGVERILEYRDKIDHEAPAVIKDADPGPEWPGKGEIQVEHISMRYRPNLPLVLKDVSVSIQGGERVGIVGRTGSGKSSLMLCLFRLVEPAEGRILIDGTEISGLGLTQLRSRLSIIPQDPVLFSGTVRSNLDPFNCHSDDDVWTALSHAHLKDKVGALTGKLEASVAEYGENFSVGERQLLCLARVLLRKNRIMIMDEATSSVDFETDRLIQATIRTHMQDSTMLIIAHRINTVIDASRILVLSHGEVMEYDTPAALLDSPEGQFSSLVEDTGEQTAAHLRKIARGELDFFAAYSKIVKAE